MGQAEQFAKRMFAKETALITGGGATWQDPPEIGLTKVQGDGLLVVQRPELLAPLAAPWPEARSHDEVMVELKMPGDHLDVRAVERALLRRQARQVQRVEAIKEAEPPWLGQEPLWLVAPHLPEWLGETRTLVRFAPGCYQVESLARFPYFLWIAANELPLRDELVPFLVARSGRALKEFGTWVAHRRPLDWLLDMVKYTSMSTMLTQEWLEQFARPDEDPEIAANQQRILQVFLDAHPQVKERLVDEGIEKGIEKGVEKGRVTEARAALRRVLALRQLVLSPEDEARIEACTELKILERWLDQAVTAATVAEALR